METARECVTHDAATAIDDLMLAAEHFAKGYDADGVDVEITTTVYVSTGTGDTARKSFVVDAFIDDGGRWWGGRDAAMDEAREEE